MDPVPPRDPAVWRAEVPPARVNLAHALVAAAGWRGQADRARRRFLAARAAAPPFPPRPGPAPAPPPRAALPAPTAGGPDGG